MSLRHAGGPGLATNRRPAEERGRERPGRPCGPSSGLRLRRGGDRAGHVQTTPQRPGPARPHEALRERLQWLVLTRRSDPIRFHPRPLRRRLAASAAPSGSRVRLVARRRARRSPPAAELAPAARGPAAGDAGAARGNVGGPVAATARRSVRPVTTEAGRRRPPAVAGGIARLPWRTLRQPVPAARDPLRRPVEAIHRASLRILEEIGVEVPGRPRARRVRRRRRRVDRELGRVRLDGAQVEELVAARPSKFTLHARNPARDVVLGGNTSSSAPSAGRRSSIHLDRGRRPGTNADFLRLLKVIAASTSSTRKAADRSSRPTCRPRPATSTSTTPS